MLPLVLGQEGLGWVGVFCHTFCFSVAHSHLFVTRVQTGVAHQGPEIHIDVRASEWDGIGGGRKSCHSVALPLCTLSVTIPPLLPSLPFCFVSR